MGYTTDFTGEITVTPPLNASEISFLYDFNNSRRVDRKSGPLVVSGGPNPKYDDPDIRNYNNPPADQPGLWCQWEATNEGESIEWDGNEKFYYADLWMKYLVDNLFGPQARAYINQHVGEDPRLKDFTCDHVLEGQIQAQGEDPDDRWVLVVEKNVVKVAEAVISYKDAKEI